MQTQQTSPLIKRLRASVGPDDMIYLVKVNYGLQIAIKRPQAERGQNITVEIGKVFGYDLLSNGLACSEWQVIEDLVETLPQIRRPDGWLNIRLL